MSYLSDKISSMETSPTIAISMLARKLKAEGKDIIPLGIGETNFRVPDNVDQGALEAIKQGRTQYPPLNGFPELKEAIINKLQRDNSLSYTPEQIIVCNGVKQVLYNLLTATLNPDDEVIIPAPYWVSYVDMVKIAGGKPVIIQCDQKNDFKLQATDLQKAISKKTKWLIFNSPNNPTGSCYTYDEIKSITNILIENPHVCLMSDDIYEHIMYDDMKFYTPAQVEPQLYDRIVTINGVSKAYAMTGWRVGYAAGNIDIIKGMSVIQSQSTSGVCSIAQYAAIAALNGSQNILRERLHILKNRRKIALDVITSTNHLVTNIPQGAFYLFISCANILNKKTKDGRVIKDDADFAKYLIEDYQVVVIPGEAFGVPGFFRLSYAASEALVRKGCERIIQACESLQ